MEKSLILKSLSDTKKYKVVDFDLTGYLIGISVSESDDLEKHQFNNNDLYSAFLRIARAIISSGCNIAYGGDLRKDGFTIRLLEMVIAYRNSSDLKRIVHYQAWPFYYEKELPTIYQKFTEQINIPKPTDLPESVYGLISEPINESRPWFLPYSLTAMRRVMIKDCFARIVLGGRTVSYLGKYPGILEEIFLSIKFGKPIFLIGAFGGATRDFINLISENCIPEYMGDNGKQYLQSYDNYYANAQKDEYIKLDNPKVSSLEQMITDSKSTEDTIFKLFNNGLNDEENKRLFYSRNMREVTGLILKGLYQLMNH